MQRRNFLKASSLMLAGATGPRILPMGSGPAPEGSGCTLALNAYSFNAPLLAGEMTLDELFRITKAIGFHGIDLTAYYIPGYPEVPANETLYEIKRMAFRLGLAISGTGVRNDFTLSDTEALEKEVQLVRSWVVAAARMGAPHVRVFAGRGAENSEPRETVKRRIIDKFQECADFAATHGVMITFQNHYDYITSTAEILEILEAVKSSWFGLMLDIGSVEGPDPYPDIERLVPYAISWQVKEQVHSAGGTVPTDFPRLMKLVQNLNYQGYFPLETLGEGDPYGKVKALYSRVASAMD
ncbi:MAG: sugar phosphate isomerase/epimerase family protein [Bacteroidales bacterium]